MTPKQANSIARLEGRKLAFYEDLEIITDLNMPTIYFYSKKSRYEAYRLTRSRDVFTGTVGIDAYRGYRPRPHKHRQHDLGSSAWRWHLLDPNGWKAQVMQMKVWPEWSVDDV